MAKKANLPEYQSNPFALCFDSFGRFFSTNAAWAVTLLVLSVFGLFMQFAGNIGSLTTTSTQTSRSEQRAESSSLQTETLDSGEIVALVVLISAAVLFVLLFAITVGTFIQGVFSYVALKSEAGQKVGFGEALNAAAQKFWLLLGAQALAMLKILGWSLLFIIPGIIAAFRYALLPYVIMSGDKQALKVGESHARTKSLVKGRLIEVFGVQTVATIIPLVGELLGLTGKAALHQQLQTYDAAGVEKPKAHWLNYLGLILTGLLVVLVLAIAIIAASVALNK